MSDAQNVRITELLQDLEQDFKASVLSARLGHNGIMQLNDKLRASDMEALRRSRPAEGAYLDLQTLERVSERSHRTISVSTLRALTDAGVAGVVEAMRGYDEDDQPPVMARFAMQWVVGATTYWDELYRPEIAKAVGCETRQIRSQFFADLAKMRQDYVHNRGKASKKNATKTQILKWYQPGQLMIPRQADYDQLFRELTKAIDEVRDPTTAELDNRTSISARVPTDLARAFDAATRDRAVKPDDALEQAIAAWLEKPRD